jgi:phytoene dehydrogenase-like protein
LTTRLFGFAAKRQVALLLARLPKLDPAPLARVSVADWLAETLSHADARALAQALVRVTTYAGDNRISAGAAVGQIQLALKNGVLYLDGGWQTLVDALTAAARTAGARILTSA